MTAALALLAKHWPLALAFALGAAVTFLLKPNPQPKVHEVATLIEKQALHEDDTTHADVGGWSRTTYDLAPAACPVGAVGAAPLAPPTVTRVTVEQHDPTVIEHHTLADQHQETAQKLDLTIAPAQAGWALQVGLEDVLHAKTLRLALRRRLFGPIWVELAAVPASKSLGAAVGVEF